VALKVRGPPRAELPSDAWFGLLLFLFFDVADHKNRASEAEDDGDRIQTVAQKRRNSKRPSRKDNMDNVFAHARGSVQQGHQHEDWRRDEEQQKESSSAELEVAIGRDDTDQQVADHGRSVRYVDYSVDHIISLSER